MKTFLITSLASYFITAVGWDGGYLLLFLQYTYVQVHSDGRTTYPICFIFYSPRDCKPELQMMYAGSKLQLVAKCDMQHVFEVRELEEMTDQWLSAKLNIR